MFIDIRYLIEYPVNYGKIIVHILQNSQKAIKLISLWQYYNYAIIDTF